MKFIPPMFLRLRLHRMSVQPLSGKRGAHQPCPGGACCGLDWKCVGACLAGSGSRFVDRCILGAEGFVSWNWVGASEAPRSGERPVGAWSPAGVRQDHGRASLGPDRSPRSGGRDPADHCWRFSYERHEPCESRCPGERASEGRSVWLHNPGPGSVRRSVPAAHHHATRYDRTARNHQTASNHQTAHNHQTARNHRTASNQRTRRDAPHPNDAAQDHNHAPDSTGHGAHPDHAAAPRPLTRPQGSRW
jgi:hypothetical protein